MPRLTKIYTKTGDDGTTGLVGGARVRKDDLRVEAYGTVDETNAGVGLCVVECERAATASGAVSGAGTNNAGRMLELATLLKSVQHDLFDLGADLATPITTDESDPAVAAMRLRIVESQTLRLERTIDRYNDHLQPLTNFVLPGGSPAAANLHLARTICRRAERIAVALAGQDEPGQPRTVNPEAIKYLNRLSDLLFVLCRVANDNGARDVLWVPGKSREQK
jgi:cob(I)alamin adenosyltransferase